MEKAKFNPEESYTWKPNDQFDLSGIELEFMHNNLSAICNADVKPAQLYIMVYEMFKITSNILQRNVENGKIKKEKEEGAD